MRWVLAAALASVPLNAAVAQGELPRELVDEDYRFRLVAPGPGWYVLDEAAAASVQPDAVAALFDPRGVHVSVVVEESGGMDAAVAARQIRDALEVEERVDERWEELELQGRPAVRFQVSGRIDGLELRVATTVFTHGEFVYQVACAGGSERLDAEGRVAESVLAGFTLLDGTPRRRSSPVRVADVRGYDWRVERGVYSSAPYGLALETPPGWRLAVGPELVEMASSAEVGAVCTTRDLYFAVIPEHAIGFPAADLAASYVADSEAAPSAGAPLVVRVAGIDVPLRTTRDEDGSTLLLGAFAHDAMGVQLLAWFPGERTDEHDALVTAVAGALRFLAPEERARLAGELAGADPDDDVGPDHGLRGGLYRDYLGELTWRRPPGWRVVVGQRARAENADSTRLALEHPGYGVFGQLDVYESFGTPDEEHAELVSVYGEPAKAALDLEIGGTPALESRVVEPGEPADHAFRIVTAQHGDTAYELVFSGFAGNLAAAEAAIDAARDAFRFGVALEEPAVRDGVYRDERLGFALARPADGWRASTRLVPADMAALAGSCGWSDGQGAEVFAIGIGGLCSTLDERVLTDLLLTELARDVGGVRGPSGPEDERLDELAGLPARRLALERPGLRFEVLAARRGNSLFLLGVGAPAHGPTLDDARELFAFLP